MTGYTFQDEFDGPAGSPRPRPDGPTTSAPVDGGTTSCSPTQMTPANVFQDGRWRLVIRATRQVTAANGDDPPGIRYHSARITTRDRASPSAAGLSRPGIKVGVQARRDSFARPSG